MLLIALDDAMIMVNISNRPSIMANISIISVIISVFGFVIPIDNPTVESDEDISNMALVRFVLALMVSSRDSTMNMSRYTRKNPNVFSFSSSSIFVLPLTVM